MVERSLSMREVRGSMPRFSKKAFYMEQVIPKNGEGRFPSWLERASFLQMAWKTKSGDTLHALDVCHAKGTKNGPVRPVMEKSAQW